MQELLQWMESIRQDGEMPPDLDRRLDLLLYAPCPVKLAVKDRIEAIAAASEQRGEPLAIHIPMGCTSVDPFDPVYKETDPDRLPAVIASIGFGDFWRREFAERFVDTGLFQAVLPAKVNPLFEQAGLIDPRGHYTIYGVTPYIFLVDTQRLGDLPVPRTWDEVLDPRYRGKLVMCGDGDDMADAVVLNAYKDHGEEGLRALAANAVALMHSSRMAKIAGSAEAGNGAVFIIPAFFAESTKQPAHVRVVWPEDGAAASPLYFLAKASERERLAELLAFFHAGFSGIDSAAWFAPLDASRPSPLPPAARLKWVGWEFIEQNDVNGLRDRLHVLFRELLRGRPCG